MEECLLGTVAADILQVTSMIDTMKSYLEFWFQHNFNPKIEPRVWLKADPELSVPQGTLVCI